METIQLNELLARIAEYEDTSPEYAFIDTICPLCHDDYDRDLILENVQELVENGFDTKILHNLEWSNLREYDSCPLCGGEYFNIMWNTLFSIDRLDIPEENARVMAWDMGWLLINDPDNGYWLASGSCGYDFTWRLAEVVYKLVGYLPFDYAHNMSRGGYVFVSDSTKKELAILAAGQLSINSKSLAYDAEMMQALANS